MLGQRLDQQMSLKKISNVKMGEFVGVSDTIVGRWKKGKAFPTSENLSKIADCLGCSADYLLGRTDEVSVGQADSCLSDDEKELIDYFRSLGKIGRRHVLTFAENEVSAEAEKGAGAVIA